MDQPVLRRLGNRQQPKPRLRNLLIDYKFAELMIKGRDSKGNIITENSVEKVVRHREEA